MEVVYTGFAYLPAPSNINHQPSTINRQTKPKVKKKEKKERETREKTKGGGGREVLPGTHVVVAPHVIVAAVLVNVFMRQATQLEEPLDDLYKPIPQPEHGPPLAPV